MRRVKLTKNLFLDEYIDEKTYTYYHNKGILKKLIYKLDKNLVESDQMLRDKFGQVTINNWMIGGQREYSGYRAPGTPYFSTNSLHSVFKASDKLFFNATSKEVNDYIRKDWKILKISAIEDDVSWNHTDTRTIFNQQVLFEFKP